MPAHPFSQNTMPPSILDVEASGFGLGSYPIEVGVILSDGRSWCSLIRPEPSWQHWDPEAALLHGITREQLTRHGRSVTEVATRLNDLLRGQSLFSDAWAHDYTWLHKLYDAARSSPSFRLDNLRTLLSESQASRWHSLKRSVAQQALLPRHRASGDARLLQLTLMALQSQGQLQA